MTDSAPEHPRTLTTLLQGAVDYAGLFPPAGLSMREAAGNFASYLESDSSWMLGRFIVPLTRLGEFESEFRALLPGSGKRIWRLSGLAGRNSGETTAALNEFNSRHSKPSGGAVIDTLELKAESVDGVLACRTLTGETTCFVEIPVDRDPEPLVRAMKTAGIRAKIRTGGITDDAFPSAAHVIRFLSACVRHEVPFKATAGLHHPLRGAYRLTYEQDSPSGLMFGFLNVFLAAAFLCSGMPEAEAQLVLEERSAEAIRFTDGGVTWGGHHIGNEDLSRARSGGIVSFGSCSFVEPVGDLHDLGFIRTARLA